MGILLYTVESLLDVINQIYNEGYEPKTSEEIDAQQVLEGVIAVLRKNPDVDVECHFETGTPGITP